MRRPDVDAANALTTRWAAAACTGTADLVLSGAAVWPLLAMLLAGATGPEREELERAVGLPAGQAMGAARALIETLQGAGEASGAVGLWIRQGLPINPAWSALMPAGGVQGLRGVPDQDGPALDAWVREHTMGIVDRCPARPTTHTLLLLVACLAMRTRWRTPFTSFSLMAKAGPWSGVARQGLRATTHDLDQVALCETSAGALTLFSSWGCDDVDVHLLLGEAEASPGQVLTEGIAALASDRQERSGSQLRVGDRGPGLSVTQIPSAGEPSPTLVIETTRFEIEVEHDLLRHDILFGLRASRERPSFAGISDVPLVIDQARQTARAVFDETGFEAAAATGISMRYLASAGPPSFRVVISVTFDRPFGFVATHRPSGLMLVAGWVHSPPLHPEVPLEVPLDE